MPVCAPEGRGVASGLPLVVGVSQLVLGSECCRPLRVGVEACGRARSGPVNEAPVFRDAVCCGPGSVRHGGAEDDVRRSSGSVDFDDDATRTTWPWVTSGPAIKKADALRRLPLNWHH